ncbi:MAG: glycosyltransferase [bacterium]|nr:glycosyltransferase [bacterium]
MHDHLVQDGGAEQVLRVFMKMWPHAPVYTAFFDPVRMGKDFAGRDIRTSFLDGLPLARRRYKWSLRWLDAAFRRFDLSEYDIVLSSASGWAKSVRTGPHTLHVCYCHTPIRYIWSDAERYITETGYPPPLKATFRRMIAGFRRRDLRAAGGVDDFIANSTYVRQRIRRYYGRPSAVIHPPVDIAKFKPSSRQGGYFLVAGRLEPYKRNDIVIEAGSRLGVPLVVMGEGTDRPRLERLAGEKVRFTGRVSDARRRMLFAEATALVNPQDEDFGITAVEALASGTPVIAYRKGGATEILTPRTGRFFTAQTPAAVATAMRSFDRNAFSRQDMVARARVFAVPRFERQVRSHVGEAYDRFTRHADRG